MCTITITIPVQAKYDITLLLLATEYTCIIEIILSANSNDFLKVYNRLALKVCVQGVHYNIFINL